MKNKQNEILTAVKVLIENKMYKEAIELINASMLPESLFTTYTGDIKMMGGGPSGPVAGPIYQKVQGGGPGIKFEGTGPGIIPSDPYTKRCIVCGSHHNGLQCPDFSITSNKQEWLKS